MRFKRLVAGGLAGIAALTLSMLVPTVAHADDGPCRLGTFCAWEDTMYQGRLQVDDLNQKDDQGRYIHGGASYQFGVSSYWNRTNFTVCAYTKNHDRFRVIVPGEQSALLEDGWNDNIGRITVAEILLAHSCNNG